MSSSNSFKTKYQLFKDWFDEIDKFLVLRFLASLAVVVMHTSLLLEPKSIFMGVDLTFLRFLDGITAVQFFFILSGYLIAKGFFSGRYQFTKSSLASFYWSRFIRIAPLYYFVTFILVIFVYNSMLARENWQYSWRILTFSYDQLIYYKHLPQTGFNIAYWAISSEVQFYILAPIFGYLALKIQNKFRFSNILFFGLCLGFLIIENQPPFNRQLSIFFAQDFVFAQLFRDLETFLLGFFLYPILTQINSKTRFFAKTSPFSVVVFILIYLISSYNVYYDRQFSALVLPLVAFLVCLLIFWTESPLLTKAFIKKEYTLDTLTKYPIRILEFLGILSYGIYLWHLPVFIKVAPVISAYPKSFNLFILRQIIVFCFVLGISWLSYFLVETRLGNVKTPKFISRIIESKNVTKS